MGEQSVSRWKQMKPRLCKMIFTYLWITIGSLFIALSLDLFLVPNKIAAGGVSGLATIIFYLFQLPIGWSLLAMNIPLFLVSFRQLGVQVFIRSIYGALVTSVGVEVLAPYVQVMTHDLLLASIYGGILAGIGEGLVLRAGGTTGGTDLVARVIHKHIPVTMGQGLLCADFVVISLAGIFFNAELALYALIALFATSKVIDLVQEGLSNTKAAYIISERPHEIAQTIMDELDRGVTALTGKGMYTGMERLVLICVVSRTEESRLKELIYENDRNAFVFFTEAAEVLGEGFKGFSRY